jgi:hypothetical protein
MKLNETIIRKTEPAKKPCKLFDGHGLYLLVNPNGSRWWKLKYRFDGVEKLHSLGVYPGVSLKLARQRREELRLKLTHGVDPSASARRPNARGRTPSKRSPVNGGMSAGRTGARSTPRP